MTTKMDTRSDDHYRFLTGPNKGRPLNFIGIPWKLTGETTVTFRDGSKAEFYLNASPAQDWKPYLCEECRVKGITWFGACPHRPPVCNAPIDPGTCEFTCTRDAGHAGEHSWELGEEIAAGICELGQPGAMSRVVENRPPICPIHHEQMVLHVYDRPGSPPGNGWGCQRCSEDRVMNAESVVGGLIGLDEPAIVQTPYVCDECRAKQTNWYGPCPHAPIDVHTKFVYTGNGDVEEVRHAHPKQTIGAYRTASGSRPKHSTDAVYVYCENGSPIYSVNRAETGTGLREWLWLYEKLRSIGRGRLTAAREATDIYFL